MKTITLTDIVKSRRGYNLPCDHSLFNALSLLVKDLGATVSALDAHGCPFDLDIPAALTAFVVYVKVPYHPSEPPFLAFMRLMGWFLL